MGDHFNKLATNLPGANPNMNLPEVQEIMNEPKVAAFLMKLQKEGKIDVEEINRDPYLASKIKVLIDAYKQDSFHLQRLYKRRKIVNGEVRSTAGLIITKPSYGFKI